MSDDNQLTEGEDIVLSPAAPTVHREETSQWMEWNVSISAQIDLSIAQHLLTSAFAKDIRVDLRLADNQLFAKVIQCPSGDYRELYFSGLRAIHLLEKNFGESAQILGISRDRWNSQFVFARGLGL